MRRFGSQSGADEALRLVDFFFLCFPSRSVITYKYNTSVDNTTLYFIYFDVLLTVHLSIFISVINQLDAQNFKEAQNKLIVEQKMLCIKLVNY